MLLALLASDTPAVVSVAVLPEFYPERALRMRVGGTVKMRCAVDASGQLGRCELLSETPGDWAFGDAALKLARRSPVIPATHDGRAVDGEATFTLRFKP